MSTKEKGSFDFGDIGVAQVTRKIIDKKIEEPPKAQPVEQPKAPPQHVEPVKAEPKEHIQAEPKAKEPKIVKEKNKGTSEMVKTSYALKKEQIDAIKTIARNTGKDFSDVLRQIIDHGIERIQKKNPEMLQAKELKDLF